MTRQELIQKTTDEILDLKLNNPYDPKIQKLQQALDGLLQSAEQATTTGQPTKGTIRL